MRPLHPIDLIFLSLEKRQQPMHVGGLFLFQIPDNAPATFIQELVRDIRTSKSIPIPPFNNYLNGLFWDEDQQFDLDHHFRHIALPKPGRIRELLTYISQEHSALIDRAKPLWTCHIIEGIEGNRFAMYFKIHHAMVDGIAGMRLVEKSLSHDPHGKSIVPPWCVEGPRAKRLKAPKVSRIKGVLSTLKGQLESTPRVIYELSQTVLKDMGRNPDYVSSFQAPSSILNQRVSASRRFAAQSFEFERLRRISKALGVTINDIVLAICSGALREYLISQDALPKKPLIAMVPASVRSDDSDVSNRITMILANLGTHKEDPLERLKIVRRSVLNAKERFKRMNANQILNYSAFVYGAAGLNIASGLMPKRQAFNLVISNVPGPQEPLYWNGARLEALYPASIVLDGQALNITMTSYLDKLEVGLTACRNSLPKMQNLLTHLEDEIQRFERIVDGGKTPKLAAVS
ncbi:wax ester/triacylglycerol synthase family O-acyltransferase [Acinetobacter schindleri]|jgi:diacylglycerol O-acyltransferase|uniref:diacylglycerol O-acyltransferase n=1 Tax=Acinetobacter schindleri TaxID=108981 RepID=A0AAE7BY06_9GAMM|nr:MULTISPECIES: wax ester/triacylglycerol synthase family O-acyltransferase [Acinetobacter]APX62189.1 bifunctional wax ester synthase/acyl-CoA:diacylglycerol acyltransferase protein [Acinetobacter schindleri]KMV00444.1 acetyltransferase [Acinetobacter sp. VT 511]MCO8066652.1 wax ester/triacylglycerol synthase family O-acyltransferase [Acinetobacter schindleri]MEB5930436.1 wax ester/triacylglycerol synthase family O-acyltransferase [Acinetobacter schindleri]POU22142.1 wax ester/triacylglycerol